MEQADVEGHFHFYGNYSVRRLPLILRSGPERRIQVVILGTAAGGGFPQWNCGCAQCLRARATRERRLQSSVAVCVEPGRWFLVNASPDVTAQVETYLRIGLPEKVRATPIAEAFVTNADLDHSLGLLLLREGPRLTVTAPAGARKALTEGLNFNAVLDSFCGVDWRDAPADWRDLDDGRLQVRAVPIAGSAAPRYAPEVRDTHAVGYLFYDQYMATQVGIFPDVPAINDELLAIFAECDALLIDGTFWSDDELPRLGISSRTARDMGHIPISGKEGSLAPLAALHLPLCAYLHLNNTNPVLDPASSERAEVEAAGLRVAEDGVLMMP